MEFDLSCSYGFYQEVLQSVVFVGCFRLFVFQFVNMCWGRISRNGFHLIADRKWNMANHMVTRSMMSRDPKALASTHFKHWVSAPFLLSSLSSLPFPSISSSFPIPLPSSALPLNSARGLGERSPSGSWQRPATKRILVYLEVKNSVSGDRFLVFLTDRT